MRWSALMLVSAVAPLLAQTTEDAEHRADRLRTAQLNRSAAATSAREYPAAGPALERYDRARERYARQLDEWRRRVAACERGDYEACDRR